MSRPYMIFDEAIERYRTRKFLFTRIRTKFMGEVYVDGSTPPILKGDEIWDLPAVALAKAGDCANFFPTGFEPNSWAKYLWMAVQISRPGGVKTYVGITSFRHPAWKFVQAPKYQAILGIKGLYNGYYAHKEGITHGTQQTIHTAARGEPD